MTTGMMAVDTNDSTLTMPQPSSDTNTTTSMSASIVSPIATVFLCKFDKSDMAFFILWNYGIVKLTIYIVKF